MMETAVLGNRNSVRFDRPSPVGFDRSILVDVWREACRHIEIQESTHTIGRILGDLGPIGQLLIRKIDRQRACLETVAVGIPVPDYLLPEARSSCDEGHLTALFAWCRKRQVLHQDSSHFHSDLLMTIVPPGIAADVVAGTLGDVENPSGVVLLVARPGRTSKMRTSPWSRPSSSHSRWPWRTTNGFARWLPCGRRRRPTRNRS